MKNTQKILANFINDTIKMMSYLYSRWQDEKEYENIDDYAEHILEKINKINAVFVKMNKRPFGFDFILDNKTFKYKVTSRQITIKRIA